MKRIAIVFLLLCPVAALARNAILKQNTKVVVGQVSTELMSAAEANGIDSFECQNQGLGDVYLAFGEAATDTSGSIIYGGGSWEPPIAPRQAVYGYSTSTTNTVVCIRGYAN